MKKTCRKRKRVTSTDTPPAAAEEPIPELSEEIVLDILVRLPVKSLLRCKSVCKGWRAIIADPFFVRAHLQHSASRCEQDPCLLINPQTIDYRDVSNHLSLYQWRQGDSMATLKSLMHDKDFGSEFRYANCLAQCDGLVLIATNLRLYLFNPATREAIKLPDLDTDRDRRVPYSGLEGRFFCASLGLDLRTGKHKVVRAFYRLIGPETDLRTDMGMEVFTVSGNSNGGSSAWREIKDVLPYPAENVNTGMAVNGFLFWRIAYDRRDLQRPCGLLRLSLADETFGITRLPDSVGPAALHRGFQLYVLHGELCLSVRICNDTVSMWMLPIQEDGDQGQTWEQRYTVYLTGVCRPLALFPGGRMMLFTGNEVCLYDMASAKLTTVCQIDRLKYQGRRAWTWKSIYAFNVHLYTESLVRISV